METLKSSKSLADKEPKYVGLENRFLFDFIAKIKNSLSININSPHNIKYISSVSVCSVC